MKSETPQDRDGEHENRSLVPQLDVGGKLENVPTGSQGLMNIRGRYPQMALQADPGSKYNGINWYDSSGRRVSALVADVADQDLSLYAKAPTGSRKAMDLNYGGRALELRLQNMSSFFVSGGDNETGTPVIGIEAGDKRGDSVLRFVDHNNRGIWSLFRDSSTSNRFRIFNHITGQTAISVSTRSNSVNFHGNSLVGLRELQNPTTSDLHPQEWAWDATASRWLYRDSSDTVHYFNPDGTF